MSRRKKPAEKCRGRGEHQGTSRKARRTESLKQAYISQLGRFSGPISWNFSNRLNFKVFRNSSFWKDTFYLFPINTPLKNPISAFKSFSIILSWSPTIFSIIKDPQLAKCSRIVRPILVQFPLRPLVMETGLIILANKIQSNFRMSRFELSLT